MAKIDFDLQKYDGEFKKAGMQRLTECAEVIRDKARDLVVIGTVTRVPGRRRFVNAEGHLVPSTNPPIWMERTPGAMKKTIRVVRREEVVDFSPKDDNVRVYAGNYKTWYAVQMEYGHGQWRGGPRPFMRKAIAAAQSAIRSIIEGGGYG